MEINKDIFKKIIKCTQYELKEFMSEILKNNGYNDVSNNDGFLYAKGIDNFLLVAHLDRHPKLKEKVITINEFEDKNKIKWNSPEGIGGDDRCGVYLIYELIKKYNPSILLCEDEEIGCIGSKKFLESKYIDELKKLNYFIQIDRGHGHKNIKGGNNKHGRDVVFYEVNNKNFIDDICKFSGYKIGAGSCTDIVHLSKISNIASFNISSGYYNEHHLDEYIVLSEVEKSFDVICNVIDNIKNKYYAFEDI